MLCRVLRCETNVYKLEANVGSETKNVEGVGEWLAKSKCPRRRDRHSLFVLICSWCFGAGSRRSSLEYDVHMAICVKLPLLGSRNFVTRNSICAQ